jgi:hypothetical protein
MAATLLRQNSELRRIRVWNWTIPAGPVDLDVERHAEVFATDDDLSAADYTDQESSDLLAVLAPTLRIGIVSNNVPHLRRQMGGQSFGEIQRRRDERRTTGPRP